MRSQQKRRQVCDSFCKINLSFFFLLNFSVCKTFYYLFLRRLWRTSIGCICSGRCCCCCERRRRWWWWWRCFRISSCNHRSCAGNHRIVCCFLGQCFVSLLQQRQQWITLYKNKIVMSIAINHHRFHTCSFIIVTASFFNLFFFFFFRVKKSISAFILLCFTIDDDERSNQANIQETILYCHFISITVQLRN